MSDIRKHYTSRFPDGYLLEVDFSQLEILVLAFLSGDGQLRKDLLSGADLHTISAQKLFGVSKPSDKQRKIAKMLSFQLQYGSGAKNMAQINGIPEATAKKFIENYYDRYPGVKKYQDDMIKKVEANRTPSSERTKLGRPAGVSEVRSLTGRRYTFKEQDAPEWSARDASFSPTQIKNYPTQGFATGDIVPLALGKLYRVLKNDSRLCDTCLMINTVHDSIVFDCNSKLVAKKWAKEAKRIMEDSPKYLKEVFDIDFDLPLNVGCDIGKNWGEMETLDI